MLRRGVRTRRFVALVPIPNGRGRHRAAPFGLGPWDGAGVASQQSLTLRPGRGYCRRLEGVIEPDKPERREEGQSFGPVVRWELLTGNSRSLPCGPTRVGPWMRRLQPLLAEASRTLLWMERPLR